MQDKKILTAYRYRGMLFSYTIYAIVFPLSHIINHIGGTINALILKTFTASSRVAASGRGKALRL
jgi:hypothetical protein